jgi:hypothetical protein
MVMKYRDLEIHCCIWLRVISTRIRCNCHVWAHRDRTPCMLSRVDPVTHTEDRSHCLGHRPHSLLTHGGSLAHHPLYIFIFSVDRSCFLQVTSCQSLAPIHRPCRHLDICPLITVPFPRKDLVLYGLAILCIPSSLALRRRVLGTFRTPPSSIHRAEGWCGVTLPAKFAIYRLFWSINTLGMSDHARNRQI